MNIKEKALIYFKGLVGARKKEIETEDHLKKIAEREEGRLEQEIQRLQKEMDELKERKNIYEVAYTINFTNLVIIALCIAYNRNLSLQIILSKTFQKFCNGKVNITVLSFTGKSQ